MVYSDGLQVESREMTRKNMSNKSEQARRYNYTHTMQLNKILVSKQALHEIKFESWNIMFLEKGAMLPPLRSRVIHACKYAGVIENRRHMNYVTGNSTLFIRLEPSATHLKKEPSLKHRS